MLSVFVAVFTSVAPVSFDAARLISLFHPGRESITISGTDGDAVTYLCKPGPAGETPQEQAEKAQVAFETNLEKFAETWVDDMMEGIDEGAPEFSEALTLSLKMDSWAGSMITHLEKEYGCLLMG
ncbi:hypothetical protein [Tabrizicola sp.]|uniref:hypothetical protein n=1 Tax=Tabrizicola sp. TaxID=2005166 RepID=UPI003F2D2F9A